MAAINQHGRHDPIRNFGLINFEFVRSLQRYATDPFICKVTCVGNIKGLFRIEIALVQLKKKFFLLSIIWRNSDHVKTSFSTKFQVDCIEMEMK